MSRDYSKTIAPQLKQLLLTSNNCCSLKTKVTMVNGGRSAHYTLLLCGYLSWYIAWLLVLLRLLANFEFPARISNKTCFNLFALVAVESPQFFASFVSTFLKVIMMIQCEYKVCSAAYHYQGRNSQLRLGICVPHPQAIDKITKILPWL